MVRHREVGAPVNRGLPSPFCIGFDGNVRPVQRSVSVSGLGVVSVFGTNAEQFRDELLSGSTGITSIKGFSVDGCRTTLAGEISGFEATSWVPPMKLRRLDRTGVYALAATKLAFADSGVETKPDGDDTTGVLLGTWTAGGQSTQQFLEALFRSGPSGAPALLFDSTVGNSAAGLTGLEFKLRGPNITVSHKEASGLAALVGAIDLLREGRAQTVVAGGVDAVFETFFKAHDRFGVMSPETQFTHRVAPFDAERQGFVMGEGAFIFHLLRSSTAGRRGRILGVAASSAAVPVNAWPNRSEPLVRTMRLAIEDAGLKPSEVGAVYASANATSLDDVEAQALIEVFGGGPPSSSPGAGGPIVTSIKGAIGESGCGGSAACAAALLCGAIGKVPPIAGLRWPVPTASGLRLAREAMDMPTPIALINSFASGGALFSVVVDVVDDSRSG
jgi:3-oxoacyl-[acyl-carrier-protein] synthase II